HAGQVQDEPAPAREERLRGAGELLHPRAGEASLDPAGRHPLPPLRRLEPEARPPVRRFDRVDLEHAPRVSAGARLQEPCAPDALADLDARWRGTRRGRGRLERAAPEGPRGPAGPPPGAT